MSYSSRDVIYVAAIAITRRRGVAARGKFTVPKMFFRLAKEKEVHTALDTAGEPYSEEKSFQNQFERLMEVTNLFLLDLKEIDPEKHRALTGKENINILQMARRLSERGKELWIRHVLVPGLTDDPEGLKRLRDFIGELKTVTRVEVLPYHTLGLFKWEKLGIPYTLKDFRTPSSEEIAAAEELLGIKR